jgi:hypothetical protein
VDGGIMKNAHILIRQLLNSDSLMPETLKSKELYTRVHDDCDGDPNQTLTVMLDDYGDTHISTHNFQWLRFRHYCGGGHSLRVRNALLILAEAIRLDNEKDPQRF